MIMPNPSSLWMVLPTLAGAFAALSAPALAASGEPSSPTTPPTVSAVVSPAPSVAPPAPPYSLPWQLRPAAPASVVRSDTSVAFYDGAAGQAGSTVATMLLASAKVTPSL